MKLFRYILLLILLISLCLLFISDSNGANALEAKKKGVEKVKCKEQVDEALRQYWDKDGKHPGSQVDDDTQDDDDDDDDEDYDSKQVTKNNDSDNDDDDDDNDSKNKDHDSDSGCDEKETNNKDDDDEDDDSKEEKSREKKNVQSKEDENEDDDSDDSKEKDSGKENSDDDADEKSSESEESEEQKIPVKKDESQTKDNKVEKSEEDENEHHDETDKDDSKSNTDTTEDDEDSAELDVEELQKRQHQQKRSRAHVDDVLKVYEIGSQDDNAEQNLISSIFRDLKRTHETTVKPLETIYKYRQITTRYITDAEIFSKPMVLFLGGKSTGKSSLANYLLGIEDTPWQIKTGAASQTKFTILSYGENYTHLSPTELSADYTFSSLQRFGEQFLTDYIDAHRLPINILQRMTIVDSPGLIDLLPSTPAKQVIDNDVYQWFIDRSDVIYIVIDVSQLYLSNSLRALLDQLKGREVRFIISKADMASHTQIISMFGQLLWVLSPIMSAERPPLVYALSTIAQNNFDEFLDEQETAWLKDLSYQLGGIPRIESHIAEVRRHAVRVRNHAKLIDCYLSTYYKNKGLFTFGDSSRRLATDISENPHQYRIYSGAFMGQLQNVSRYDLPDPGVYREFFRSNPLIDFKPLTSTCSYFRGCPIDRLDVAIAYDLPELLGKYRKLTKTKLDQH